MADFTAPYDIKIVGSYIDTEINNHSADWDSGGYQGRIAICANLSILNSRQEGVFNQCESILMFCKTTDAGISTVTITGEPYESNIVMFPSGTGVSLNAGEKVYLHAGWENLANEVHQMGTSAIIYYVRR